MLLGTLTRLFTFAMQQRMLRMGQSEIPFSDRGIIRLGSYSGAMGKAFTETRMWLAMRRAA